MARVLVVDDEAIITMQLEERLSSMGYKVVGMAASGEEAIAKTRQLKPELVLMDIVMPGKINGIAAARVIGKEMGLPVIFITSYADDAIINEAKQVNPYGYIVKPFNELELKAALELAIFRKKTELLELSRRKKERAAGDMADEDEDQEGAPDGEEDLIGPESKTVLLHNFYQGILLVLYTPPFRHDALFKNSVQHGAGNGCRIFYAYNPSGVRRHLVREFQQEHVTIQRIKKDDLEGLLHALGSFLATGEGPGEGPGLQVLIDLSETGDFEKVLEIKDYLLAKKASGAIVSGILCVNIQDLTHEQVHALSLDIPKVIVSTEDETSISIANQSYPLEQLSVVPHAVVEEIVRKSLEPLVLSILKKPLSGFDIVHEIYDRHQVLIPQSRIYAILYDLQRQGVVEVRVSGKSKLYVPTAKGQRYIQKKVNEFRWTFQHIFGGMNSGSEGISSKD